jgi:ribosome biogenesis SPOUT family RNA methylase Rps3
MHKIVIQHLEPELGKWSMIEYKHISKFLGGPERFMITNVKHFPKYQDLQDIATVIHEDVTSLNLENVCVLDPEAQETLTPQEAKNIDYFLFGGILGGYPPKKRTEKELTQFVPSHYIVRNIGKYQMPTDSAVFTVNEIAKGRRFEDIEFKDRPEFQISQYETVQIPMRYAVVSGKPLISPELLDHWANSDDDWLFGSEVAAQDHKHQSDEDE